MGTLQVLVSVSPVEDHNIIWTVREKLHFSTTFFRICDFSKDPVERDQCTGSLPLSHRSFTPEQRELRDCRALLASRMPNPALSYSGISRAAFLLSITESRALPTLHIWLHKKRVGGNPSIIVFTRLVRRKIPHIE